MADQQNKFYLTTPIYYVNARPHIGHAYTTIVADVLARRHRLLGEETFFLTGTDEHGQKIERSAAAAGEQPQEFADRVSKQFRDLWDRMGLTYDGYIRTTAGCHKQGVQRLFQVLWDKGFIYLDKYTGAYCVSDEAFVDLPVGTPCPDCGRLLEEVTEENFFFRLSAFQEKLIALIESNDLLIEPATARNEVLSFVRGGLKDLSVSRSSFTWGIPVPDAVQKAAGTTQKHVVYVWLDALTNYMTAVGYGSDEAKDVASFKKWWPADLHLVGKEITRFHCVYWPAFLMAAELPLPKRITANGWLLFDNAKMSKSKGNVVRTETILEAFGEHVYAKQFPESTKRERDLFAADVLRYFLLREIPFGQDGSFSFDALVTRYNADLANGYGNLVSRVLTMIAKNFDGKIPDGNSPSDSSLMTAASFESALGVPLKTFAEYLDSNRFNNALEWVSSYLAGTDQNLSQRAPWKLKSEDERPKLAEILYASVEAVRILTILLYPFLPFTTAKVWQQLGLGDIEEAARNGELKNLQWGGLKPGTKLGALAPIFPRADKGLAQIMIDMENPTPQQEEPKDSTHPAAAPRAIDSKDAPAGTLPVAGSTAETTRTEAAPTKPTHTEAQASGVFAAEAQKAAAPEGVAQITIDDFAKVEMRVAQIKVAERIPKADKLLRLEVDLGTEQRQILSGIAEWYTPEELIGRKIVVITNLAPRKMRGLESHGMLLAASEEGGKPVLATFGEDIAVGARLK